MTSSSGYLALADRYGVTLAGGDVSAIAAYRHRFNLVGEVNDRSCCFAIHGATGRSDFRHGNSGRCGGGLEVDRTRRPRRQRSEVRGQKSEPPAVAGGSESQVELEEFAIQSLLLRQLSPQPRVGWGIVLGEEQLATSMIDISDGLSSDLHHLCAESNVGALIDAASLPLDEHVIQLCGRRALDPLALALHGGEDFELLFTVAARKCCAFAQASRWHLDFPHWRNHFAAPVRFAFAKRTVNGI